MLAFKKSQPIKIKQILNQNAAQNVASKISIAIVIAEEYFFSLL